MVQCKWCKKKVQGNRYYLLKFSGEIIAHFCSLLCLSGWARTERARENNRPKRQQAPLFEFYDHLIIDDTSEKEVINE